MIKRVSLIGSIVVIFFIFFSLSRQTYDALNASGRLDQAADSLSRLQQKNRLLQDQIKQVSSYDFVEKEARNDLNLAKSNETVVIIPDSMIEKVLGAEKKPEIKLPNYQGWLKLIFH